MSERADRLNEIISTLPDNSHGQITASILRSVLEDIEGDIDHINIPIEKFGGIGDYSLTTGTGTDNLAAMRAAIASFGALWASFYRFYKTGPKIVLGYGAYYFSDTIIPDRTMVIEGVGPAHGNGGFGSTAVVAAGKSFIKLNPFVGDDPNTSIPGAAFSRIRNMAVLSKGFGGQTTSHGIDVGCQCDLFNVNVVGFGGHGINIFADSTGGSGSNSNLSSVLNCWSNNNARSGMFIQGGDVNAIYTEQFCGNGNGEWGLEDESFLGNTHVAAHVAGNGFGAYKATSPNSRCLFAGCYSEGDQPPSQINAPATVVSGLHAAGIIGTAIYLGDSGLSPIRVTPAVTDLPPLMLGFRQGANSLILLQAPVGTYKISHSGGYTKGATSLALGTGSLPIANGSQIWLTGHRVPYTVATGITGPGTVTLAAPGLLQDAADGSLVAVGTSATAPLDFRWDSFTQAYGWQWANADSGWSYYLSDENSIFTCGRSATIPPNSNIFSKGLWVGNPNEGALTAPRQLMFGSVAPTSGTWAQGDRVLSNAPTAGGTEGWVCVTAGTPGTWKTFGSIAA